MKKITTLLFLLVFASFSSLAQSHVNALICSNAACSGPTLSSGPTDGTTFYTVWVVNSSVAPIGASITPTGSASASFGSPTISSIGGTYYTITWPTTMTYNQGLPTTFAVATELKLYTSSPFIPSLTSTYSIPAATALPVEFIKVFAYKLDNTNVVQWSTASELNNQLFVVEASVDGINWVEIGMHNGAGNSNEIIDYKLVDRFPLTSGKMHYRIMQQDFDGVTDYSDVVTVKDNGGAVVVFPNPIVGNDIVLSGIDVETAEISITNQMGQVVNFELNATSGKMTFDELANGIYFLTVNGEVTKIVK